MSSNPGEFPPIAAIARPSPPPPQRRRWPWILAFLLLSACLLSGGIGYFFWKGIEQASAVANDQLAIISTITGDWNLETLYKSAAPELRQTTADAVARKYFETWKSTLGKSLGLSVTGYYFNKQAVNGDMVSTIRVTYSGRFEYGTADVVVLFRDVAGRWAILMFNVVNITPVSTQPSTSDGGF